MDLEKKLQIALEAGLQAGEAILGIYGKDHFEMTRKADRSPLTEADRDAHDIISSLLSATGIPVLSEEGREISWAERSVWKHFWLVDPLDGTKEFIRRNGEFTVNIALIEDGRPVLGIIYAPVDDLMYAGRAGKGAWKIGNASRLAGRTETYMAEAERLPREMTRREYTVVASRSHINPKTRAFIRTMRRQHPALETLSRGSALKFCLVAEGAADVYPRFGPTWEWDTGAGHAIAEAAGCRVSVWNQDRPLLYNKQELLNPWFIVQRD